ncbi:Di-copper centre-containing protein [Mycena capillaripes]|nr:Di-copper centre-containing protein [Mycena capillaripes]
MPCLLALYFVLTWFLSLGGAVEIPLLFPGGAPKCVDPLVRQEWRSLSREERVGWITGVKCLASLPHDDAFVPSENPSDIAPHNTSGSLYDDMVYAHMDLNHRIHWTGLFYPWHRWYLHVFENALRNRCGYEGPLPYWDWTKDAADLHQSTFFKDSDPQSGLGGWGDASTQFRVLDGAFSAASAFILSLPYNRTRPANATFTTAVVESLINGFAGDYKGFHAFMEGVDGPHLNVHFMVGGDVGGQCPTDAPPGCLPGPTFASNDPLFWLHHAMIDRIWFQWQKKHELNKYAFEGGSVQRLENATAFSKYPTGSAPYLTMNSEIPTDGLSPTFTVADMISTTEEPLCYVYD